MASWIPRFWAVSSLKWRALFGTECRNAGGVKRAKQEREYRLRWPRRKGRAACRAPGYAGFALAPPPLRGRRTPNAKGERQQSAGASSPHRRNEACESMTPNSTCFAARSAAPRCWSARALVSVSVAALSIGETSGSVFHDERTSWI